MNGEAAVAFVSSFQTNASRFPEIPPEDCVHPVTNAWPLPSTATLVAASAAGPPM